MAIKTIAVGPITNFYAVEENGKTMLIDTGCYLNQPGWTLKCVLSGVDLSSVSLIVLTHGHMDHAGGIHHAKVITGAPIMAHPGAETFLKTGKFTWYVPRNAEGQAFYDNIAAPAPVDIPEPVDIDIPVTEETDLHPYGFSAKVIMTPGHTLDAISVVLDSGEAFVGGFSCTGESAKIKPMIGISTQDTAVAERLTVRENLEFMARIYGFGQEKTAERVNRTVADFHLEEVLDQRAGTLSGGWKRKLSIAMALIGEPSVLFLDEPTLGLDVLARRELWRVIESLKGSLTIVLTTHYMEEAEHLSDRVGIMISGRIAACGTLPEILEMTGKTTLEDAFVAIAEGEVTEE